MTSQMRLQASAALSIHTSFPSSLPSSYVVFNWKVKGLTRPTLFVTWFSFSIAVLNTDIADPPWSFQLPRHLQSSGCPTRTWILMSIQLCTQLLSVQLVFYQGLMWPLQGSWLQCVWRVYGSNETKLTTPPSRFIVPCLIFDWDFNLLITLYCGWINFGFKIYNSITYGKR